eukprot:CAMPEP_0113844952 /NCGR_PEP_ID=MMETSP0372-20130328/501_1 /TAXON_ID=340204 /ORGANISM="Lankesteria abbotti" /LENGTH=153 /DNA_ID=CAMNT_0000813969 /DNA_START=645 /DNA_END=1106 /DNA_ORIENTATION=- /assembly_acc=CAM_ASM_000359
MMDDAGRMPRIPQVKPNVNVVVGSNSPGTLAYNEEQQLVWVTEGKKLLPVSVLVDGIEVSHVGMMNDVVVTKDAKEKVTYFCAVPKDIRKLPSIRAHSGHKCETARHPTRDNRFQLHGFGGCTNAMRVESVKQIAVPYTDLIAYDLVGDTPVV